MVWQGDVEGNHHIFALFHGKYPSKQRKPCVGKFTEGIVNHYNRKCLRNDCIVMQTEKCLVVSCVVVSPKHKDIFISHRFCYEDHIFLCRFLKRPCIGLHHNGSQSFTSGVPDHRKGRTAGTADNRFYNFLNITFLHNNTSSMVLVYFIFSELATGIVRAAFLASCSRYASTDAVSCLSRSRILWRYILL